MPDAHPYAGCHAVLATMHGKQSVIAPPLMEALRLDVFVVPALDTDQLGTFSGEIERVGTMLEVAVRKARLGMDASGVALGLASEGSFGPHPAIPFLPGGVELLAFVDAERNTVLHETVIAEATNFSHLIAAPDESIESFLESVGFPSHGLLVRPNAGNIAATPMKGITERRSLDRAIAHASAQSTDGKARIETDMRAHFNPTRMKSIAVVAERLARRLAKRCPRCSTPGFGLTGTREGLECEECGAPTEMVVAELHGCPACDFVEHRPRFDGLRNAPVQYCPQCNP